MMALLIGVHVIVCVLLLFIVLIQSGRGGGFVEGFTGMESMLGTRSNALLTRTTTILSVMFFITCLSLAVLSARQGKSLLEKAPVPVAAAAKQETAQKQEQAKTEVPKETPKDQAVK